jgi:RimJ/RimL family protein N-acetyltransferase
MSNNISFTSLWQGKNVRLRAMEPSDWETYFAWNQDDEMARRTYYIPLPQSQESVKRFAERQSLEPLETDNFRFVVENNQREVVGDITVNNCNPRNGTFSWGLNTKMEHRRKGYASEALKLVMRYYFRELRYQKVTVHIYSFNEPSVKLHESLGFQLEGRIRRAVFTNDQYFDELIYGLTKEEFAASGVGQSHFLSEDRT